MPGKPPQGTKGIGGQLPDLEEMIRRRQDELRGRPLNWWDHFFDRIRGIDWVWVGFCVCVLGAATAYILSIWLKVIAGKSC